MSSEGAGVGHGGAEGLDDYVVGAPIGDGIAGVRLAGRYRKSGHPVCLERLPTALVSRPEFLDALAESGERAATLSDEHLVDVYDLVRGGNRLYLVTELVRGRSLRTILADEPQLPADAALLVADSVLEALEALHGAGLVHTGVAPETVVVSPNGDVLLGGVALAAAMTRAGEPPLGAMPPEGDPADPTAEDDLWAVASLLHRMLTGRVAQPGAAAGPPAVAEVLRRALAESPRRRPRDAASFRGDLVAAAARDLGDGWRGAADLAAHAGRPLGPVPGPPPATPEPDAMSASAAGAARPRRSERRAARRRRWPWVLLALVVLAAAALVAVDVTLDPLNLSNRGPLRLDGPVQLSVDTQGGGCDTTFLFAATGQLSGSGTLTYRWEPSDGGPGPTYTVTIKPDDGSFRFTTFWQLTGPQPGTHSMTFHLLTPQSATATQKLTYSCAAP